jgi:biotin carboxyl carrier protein
VKFIVTAGDRTFSVEVPDGSNGDQPRLQEPPEGCDVRRIRPGLYSVLIDGRSHEVALHGVSVEAGTEAESTELLATVDGVGVTLALEDERRRALRLAETGLQSTGTSSVIGVSSPMPGRIAGVPVQPGEMVERGQTVVVLEAMKMESVIAAPSAGTVAEVLVSPGQAVQQRQVLLRIQTGPA